MKTIWLVVTDERGAHNAGWPIRAFATKIEAEVWAVDEHRRVETNKARGLFDPNTPLGPYEVEEVPFGANEIDSGTGR